MISNNSTQSNRIKQFEREFYTEYSDLSDEDYDDDEDSDVSINFNNTLRNDDLNSSLSSVSSLEFEPFETTNQTNSMQRQKKYTKVMRPKFDPLVSSSRSTLMTNSKLSERRFIESSRKLSFEPFTTSSRRSLLLNASTARNEEIRLNHCPICDIDYDLKREECLQCQHNYSISSSRFFMEENICSSTVISVNKRNSTFNAIQSDKSSLIKRSFSSSSSSSSNSSSASSSSLSSTKLSNEISCIQSNQPNYFILNDTYV
jgi:hypothetical protein